MKAWKPGGRMLAFLPVVVLTLLTSAAHAQSQTYNLQSGLGPLDIEGGPGSFADCSPILTPSSPAFDSTGQLTLTIKDNCPSEDIQISGTLTLKVPQSFTATPTPDGDVVDVSSSQMISGTMSVTVSSAGKLFNNAAFSVGGCVSETTFSNGGLTATATMPPCALPSFFISGDPAELFFSMKEEDVWIFASVNYSPGSSCTTSTARPLSGKLQPRCTSGDSISFVSGNGAPAVSPQPGTTFLGSTSAAQLPGFSALALYTLNSQPTGNVVLQLRDQNGNPIPGATGPPFPVFLAANQIAGSTTNCVGPGAVPGICLFIPYLGNKSLSLTSVNLVALLEDNSGNILATSDPINYPIMAPQVTLALGSGGGGFFGTAGFVEAPENTILVGGNYLPSNKVFSNHPTVRAEYTYPGSQGQMYIIASTDNRQFYRTPRQPVQQGSGTLIFGVDDLEPPQVQAIPPQNTESVSFQAVIVSGPGQTFTSSPATSYPLQSLKIVQPLLDPSSNITCGKTLQLGFTVEYQAPPNGATLKTSLTGNLVPQFTDPPMSVTGSNFVTRTYSGKMQCTGEQSFAFEADLGDQTAYIFYSGSVTSPFTIPTGASETPADASFLDTLTNPTPWTGTSSTNPLGLNASQPQSQSTTPQSIPHEFHAASATSNAIPLYIGVYRTWQFSPPIAANAGFAANLTLNYTSADLPDDPNFRASAMQIVSFDPSTNTFASYPTTVNTTNQTATAAINGLAPYYSLAVLGPFSSSQIDLPLVHISPPLDTKIALVNTGSAAAHLSLNGYGSDGTLIGNSPVASALSPSAQSLKSMSAVGLDTSQWLTGWDQIGADSIALAGAEIIVNGTQFDALPLAAGHYSSSVLTDLESDNQYDTEIDLVNPAANNARNYTVTLYNSSGATAGTYSGTLQPKARLSATVDQLFTSITIPFYGYAIVTGDGDIVASSLISSYTSLTGVAGHPAGTQGSGAITLYSAQLGAANEFTRVVLVNAGSTTANLVFTAYQSDGTSAAQPVIMQLASGAQTIADLTTLFGLATPTAGNFTITSDQPTVFGDLTFGDSSFAQVSRASVPLVTAGAGTSLIPYVENDSGATATINIANPNGGAASVILTTFDSTGAQQGSMTVNIPATGAMASVAPGIVSGGYVTLSSTQPVVAFAVVAPTAGGDIAAIAAQPVASVTGVANAP